VVTGFGSRALPSGLGARSGDLMVDSARLRSPFERPPVMDLPPLAVRLTSRWLGDALPTAVVDVAPTRRAPARA